jgi:hypothetical protein
MRSEGLALLATAHPDDPLLCPAGDANANRDGVLLRYLRARKTVPAALEQLRGGIAWRRAMKVHEWHNPAIVSPRGILADTCSQVYCCDSGYRDRQGRPYMVGAIGTWIQSAATFRRRSTNQIQLFFHDKLRTTAAFDVNRGIAACFEHAELFEGTIHDPDKHLLAIYYGAKGTQIDKWLPFCNKTPPPSSFAKTGSGQARQKNPHNGRAFRSTRAFSGQLPLAGLSELLLRSWPRPASRPAGDQVWSALWGAEACARCEKRLSCAI